MSLTLRDATPADETAWRGLWQQYLDFYSVILPEAVTAATWSRCLSPASPMGLRLAEDGGTAVGFALHLVHESSWSLTPDCYLEDLFVTDAARGKGAGRALLDDLAALARARGCARLYWLTAKDNARARALYDSYTPTDDHLRYRITL